MKNTAEKSNLGHGFHSNVSVLEGNDGFSCGLIFVVVNLMLVDIVSTMIWIWLEGKMWWMDWGNLERQCFWAAISFSLGLMDHVSFFSGPWTSVGLTVHSLQLSGCPNLPRFMLVCSDGVSPHRLMHDLSRIWEPHWIYCLSIQGKHKFPARTQGWPSYMVYTDILNFACKADS